MILLDAGGWATDFFTWFCENANYLFVFIFMAIESSFIPFPSELVVPPAAYLALQDGASMNIYLVILFATFGALIGAFINYYLAIWLGRPLVYKFANSRFGNICLLDQSKVEKAEAYFDKHGVISTFIGRLIPGIRQLISIPAGLARMSIIKFSIFTTLGALVWNIALAAIGYILTTIPGIETTKDLLLKVEEYNHYLTYAGFAIGGICVVFILWNIFKPKK
ncbi:MAG: DedA family protein [Bacteroidales bacterium]|nr:DedA family protein [Bacteroidales bacterium]